MIAGYVLIALLLIAVFAILSAVVCAYLRKVQQTEERVGDAAVVAAARGATVHPLREPEAMPPPPLLFSPHDVRVAVLVPDSPSVGVPPQPLASDASLSLATPDPSMTPARHPHGLNLMPSQVPVVTLPVGNLSSESAVAESSFHGTDGAPAASVLSGAGSADAPIEAPMDPEVASALAAKAAARAAVAVQLARREPNLRDRFAEDADPAASFMLGERERAMQVERMAGAADAESSRQLQGVRHTRPSPSSSAAASVASRETAGVPTARVRDEVLTGLRGYGAPAPHSQPQRRVVVVSSGSAAPSVSSAAGVGGSQRSVAEADAEEPATVMGSFRR